MTTDVQHAYEEFIHKNHYARWIEDEGRRENWDETVLRVVNYFKNRHPELDDGHVFEEMHKAILNKEVMPSMRVMATAGPALTRDNAAAYNCAYLHMNRTAAFDELMYLLLCGCGVGYSVERQFTEKLPEIPADMYPSDTTIVVPDSKLGWATSFRELIAMLYAGKIPKWDVSRLRPAGAKLKTFGGRASGPEPLVHLFNFCVTAFTKAAGRRLRPIEIHDINCKTAECIVVGGIRRSAMIALFDRWDEEMLHCKSGDWYSDPTRQQRALANNSAVFTETPSMDEFLSLWGGMYNSKSGEPGIFNRRAAQLKAAANGKREGDALYGTNPCCEIILKDRQFCNLTEVVARPDDDFKALARKVGIAAILGTMQATFTDFRYLSKAWKNNCEEERLLGVSITGIYDRDEWTEEELNKLRDIVIETNDTVSKIFGIRPSAATTCVKPSGTVSQLVGASSGIHPRHSLYYIRRVRSSKINPMSRFLADQGVPHVEEGDNLVFSFPLKSPESRITSSEEVLQPYDMLRKWELFNTHWCEHKPSKTIYYTDKTLFHIGQWVFNNFDTISGLSFFPYYDAVIPNAPYEKLDREQYDKLVDEFPEIDWEKFIDYEKEDTTESAQEIACTGGACEL